MKIILPLAFVAILSAGCSHTSNVDQVFTIDSLFRFNSADQLIAGLADSSPFWYNIEGNKFLLDSTAQEMNVVWKGDLDKSPWIVKIKATARNFPQTNYPHLPNVWRTKEGAYAWITVDSLQLLNGKPFYLTFDGKVFKVMNWEEGKMAGCNADFLFALEGAGKAEGLMSSEDIINKKLKVRATEMKVWGSDWPMANQKASNGIAGIYPQGSLKILAETDVVDIGHADLRIMRNEIFARHGYVFKSDDLESYFKYQPWYMAQFDNVEDKLTDVEKKNIAFIAAREIVLLRSRPVVGLIKQLSLLTLPLNLESIDNEGHTANGIALPNTIERPDGEDPTDWVPEDFEQVLYGMLPDTSRYYGVVWYGYAGAGALAGQMGNIYLTTLDKNFRPIATESLRVSHDMTRYGSSDCNTSEFLFASELTEDLRFRSTFSTTVSCPVEEGEPEDDHEETELLEGRVSRDGSIVIVKHKLPE